MASVDMETPQAQIAQHFMRHKGEDVAPYAMQKLEGQACWYFYYHLEQGVLELEVSWDARREDWNTLVTAFPAAL